MMKLMSNPDAYWFVTKYTPNNNCIIKAQTYDLAILEMRILCEHKDIKNSKEYSNTKSIFYDLTMSCDSNEAKRWLNHYVIKAIAYGLDTKDLNWQYYFLSAYDILGSLT